jgi:hypothetical protein
MKVGSMFMKQDRYSEIVEYALVKEIFSSKSIKVDILTKDNVKADIMDFDSLANGYMEVMQSHPLYKIIKSRINTIKEKGSYTKTDMIIAFKQIYHEAI